VALVARVMMRARVTLVARVALAMEMKRAREGSDDDVTGRRVYSSYSNN
jgi:hypothetical protein